MSDVFITTDDKRPHQFLVNTKRDVSLFGWETKEKFNSYYMDQSPWNLIDLNQNKGKLGLSIEYDKTIESIVQGLRDEFQIIRDAQKYKNMDVDELEEEWNLAGFPILFPKLNIDPKFKVDIYQKRDVLFSLAIRKSGAFLEQGLGKTLVGILILGKLYYDGIIKRPLVIAPLSLLSHTAWFQDLEKFSELQPINLRDSDSFYDPQGHISFVNPDKLQSWCWIKTAKTEHTYDKTNFFEMMKYDAIFFDESSMLKGHSSYRTQAFLNICKHAKYITLASGVPAPNNIFQIWSSMKSLGSVLGDNYSAFEQRYGILKNVGITSKYFPRHGAEFEIRKRIDWVTYFIERDKVIILPKRHFVTVDVELYPEHMEIYKKIEKDNIAAVHGFDEVGNKLEGKAVVEHQAAMRMKLLQILNGFTKVEDGNKKKHLTLPWNAKLDKLDEMVTKCLSESESNNIIIWCRFRWEIETIFKKYENMASYIYGGMTDKKREDNLNQWKNNKNIRIMIAIASSAKFGHTWLKANNTIYFSCTEDYEDYIQSHDRNYRRGQTNEVTESRLITKGTIERNVWLTISSKKRLDKFMKEYYGAMPNPYTPPT